MRALSFWELGSSQRCRNRLCRRLTFGKQGRGQRREKCLPPYNARMSLRTLLLHGKLLIVFWFFTSSAISQTTALGQNCDLAILGARENKSFLQFDREFRNALSNQDAGMMALLVKPSLRVSNDRGSYHVEDAGSLQSRFQDIFSSKVREIVEKERPQDLTCLSGGVMYGDGAVWVEFTGQRYAISAVNIPGSGPAKPAQKTVEFVCNADKHRVIVDAVGDSAPRYRAWTKPHPLTEKPDIEIPDGKREFGGSGPCSYTSWTFTKAGATYSLHGPGGCYEDSHQPPADSNGSLDVSVSGKEISWWCR